ncbi:MAG: MFS transporter [Ilumatobacteraceae bacterium]
MSRRSLHARPTSGRSIDSFASLRIETYRTLFTIGALGFLATQSQVIARGWLANGLADSNTGLGGVFMAFGVPMLLATPVAGVAADRYPKRLILVATFAMLAASSLWIAVAVSTDTVAYWMLLATSAIQAVAFSFMVPARMALTVEVVGRDLLSNAVALGQMSMNSARVVGPALAGLFIGVSWIGVGGVYYAAAALSSIAVVGSSRLPAGHPSPGRPERSVRREFADGLSYVWTFRPVAHLLVVSFVVVMIGFPFMAFLPRFATEDLHVGSSGYGLLAAVSAVGAVALSFAIAGRAEGRSAWRIQSAAGLTFGVGLMLLAISPGYLAAAAAVACVGAASTGFQAMNNTLVLALSDLEFHGRVQSLMMLSFSGFGMAALPLGMLADAIGLRETIAVMGAVVIAAVLVHRSTTDRPVASPTDVDISV